MISSVCFAQKETSPLEKGETLSQSTKKDFKFKSLISNKRALEKFTRESLIAVDIQNKKQIEQLIDKSTEGLFFHKFATTTPLLSEFIFQAINAPQSISHAISILLMRNELIIFTFGMIFSFMCSHFLGEFKFNFQPLSISRILFGVLRFSSINVFRIWLFTLLFGKNLAPLGKVYLNSLQAVADSHPILLKSSVFISSFF